MHYLTVGRLDESLNSTAYFAVVELASKAIFNAMVNGTESNIPTVPNNHPQNNKDKNTTKVERPSFLPITRGSRALPMPTLITTTPTNTPKPTIKPFNNNACTMIGTAAIMDPIFGI